MSPEKVARIKACKGTYSVRDTARFFGESKTAVHDIWQGKRYTHTPPALEVDDVICTRVSRDIVVEDAPILLSRGLNVVETAQALGVGKTRLYQVLKEEGISPAYFA